MIKFPQKIGQNNCEFVSIKNFPQYPGMSFIGFVNIFLCVWYTPP